MQETLRKLEKVQEIDLQIFNLQKKRGEFPERIANLEKDLAEKTTRYDEKKKFIDELEKNRRQQLGALELNDDRAKRSQEKLELIKTNQEYSALQKEIESLAKNSAVLKEASDKSAEEIKKHSEELAVLETAMNEAKGRYDAEASKISTDTRGLDGDLAKLMGQRADAITGIEKRYLAAYDRVRTGRNGVGLAIALGGTCRACNMRIPPQMFNELQRGSTSELFMCPSCRRILLYREAEAQA